jgi:DNA-directed RNA polymerase specialized sigma24 family protein
MHAAYVAALAGDGEALRDAMRPLVYKMAHRYKWLDATPAKIDELADAIYVGVWIALPRYDPEHKSGSQFHTFADTYMKAEALKWGRSHGAVVFTEREWKWRYRLEEALDHLGLDPRSMTAAELAAVPVRSLDRTKSGYSTLPNALELLTTTGPGGRLDRDPERIHKPKVFHGAGGVAALAEYSDKVTRALEAQGDSSSDDPGLLDPEADALETHAEMLEALARGVAPSEVREMAFKFTRRHDLGDEVAIRLAKNVEKSAK